MTSTSAPRTSAAVAVLVSLMVTVLACGANGGPRPGASPIVLGPPGICEVDPPMAPYDVTVFGADAGDFLADRFSLASGDFNGDGFDDLLIGAPLADGSNNARENAGEAYVIFGSAHPPDTIDLARGAAMSLTGVNASDNLGFTVAAADVNGDGIDDVIVGARFASPLGRIGAGAAYVVFGRSDLSGRIDLASADADAAIFGPLAGEKLTFGLAAGDVDGDGAADLLLGASGSDGPDGDRRGAGAVYVVRGGPDLFGPTDLAIEPPHFTVYGAEPGDGLPNHLAAGDLDGDGRLDLIAGAPFADFADREDAGRVYALSVPGGGGARDLREDEDAAALTGAGPKDLLGHQVASGDIDGDGRDDLIAGARDADGVDDLTNNSGELHVVFGGRLPQPRDLARERSDMTIYSGDAGDSLGFSVATGDINGDGLADLLAGVPLADGCENGRTSAGDAYAILGRRDAPLSVTLVNAGDRTYTGAEEGDALGFSVAVADFNGDGLGDIVIGALQADGPDNSRPDAGEAYVILSDDR